MKHSKRFFSSAAKELFDHLFSDVEARQYWDDAQKKDVTVVRELPEGFELFRARVCDSNDEVKNALKEPMKNIGPPPPVHARANRMNVDGVAVFYGALESETCLAELRPTIGGESAVITVRTTKALRLLDFTKIKNSGRALSYFSPTSTNKPRRIFFFGSSGALSHNPSGRGGKLTT